MTRPYMAFPPLSWTFRSKGYINASQFEEDENVVMPFRALSISVITEVEDIVETTCSVEYPCPPDFELDNWSIVEILLPTNCQSNAKCLYHSLWY